MKPTWMIQTNMDGVDNRPMIAEIKTQGMDVIPIRLKRLSEIDFTGYNTHGCILCYGDIDFVRQVRTRAPFIPGAWCNFGNMKCSTYYAHLGEHLLNKQYIMMPVGDLPRRWTEMSVEWDGGWLFIRPDSGAKPFTGFVVKPDEQHRIESLIAAIGPETLVVVAPEKQIDAEWRFVICNGKVVTGCRYLPDESTFFPRSSFRLAQAIASCKWQPDICYTVDIAESCGKKYLLEINSFSCAGLYMCDMESIIREVSIAATEEWGEYYA